MNSVSITRWTSFTVHHQRDVLGSDLHLEEELGRWRRQSAPGASRCVTRRIFESWRGGFGGELVPLVT